MLVSVRAEAFDDEPLSKLACVGTDLASWDPGRERQRGRRHRLSQQT